MPDVSTRPTELKPLTVLRFAAAAWVTLADYWPDLHPEATPPIVAHGRLGVELFFVLSGFILTHVYLDGFGAGRFHYVGFVRARFARLYPLHVATLAAVAAMAAIAGATAGAPRHFVGDWSALAPNLLMIQAWHTTDRSAWNHASWSLSAEWAAYLAFPAFAALGWRLRRRPRLALMGSVLAGAGLYAGFQTATGRPLTQVTTDFGWLRIAPCFAYGCALQGLWRRLPTPSPRLAELRAVGAAALLMLAAAFAAAPDALVAALSGVLILTLADLGRSGSRRLTHPALLRLGEASFALYMLTIPWRLALGAVTTVLLHAPRGAAWPPALWTLLLAGLVLLALAIHVAFERPARELLRGRPSRRTPSPRAAAPSFV